MNCDVRVLPAEVFIEGDLIVVDGPGCLAFTITAEAAQETAERLQAAVVVLASRQALGTPH